MGAVGAPFRVFSYAGEGAPFRQPAREPTPKVGFPQGRPHPSAGPLPAAPDEALDLLVGRGGVLFGHELG